MTETILPPDSEEINEFNNGQQEQANPNSERVNDINEQSVSDQETFTEQETIETRKTIKKVTEKLEEYLPIPDFVQKVFSALSIFIPFVFLSFGTVSQVFALREIGVGYIRFFSVSQLLSDSLVIFSTALLNGLIPLVLGIAIGSVLNDLIYRKVKEKLERFKSWALATLVLLLLNISFSTMKLWFLSMITLGAQFYILYYITMKYMVIEIKEGLKARENKRVALGITITVFTHLVVFMLLKSSVYDELVSVQHSLTFGKELMNYKKIHKNYVSKNIKDKVLYFNDHYIFIELKWDTTLIYNNVIPLRYMKREIEIKKFGDIFNEDNSQTILMTESPKH